MKTSKGILIAVSLVAGSAFAQGTATKTAVPPQGGMDFSKMGPWTRKPTNEKQIKKEITEFMESCDAVHKSGDFSAAIAKVDFPVYMITDDAKGTPEAQAMGREEYTAMMKPFFENMPKDMKRMHKANITVLSDSLVNVVDEFTMTMGGQKLSGKSAALLVKRDGQWKWKSMTEGGWGGMAPHPKSAASGSTRTN